MKLVEELVKEARKNEEAFEALCKRVFPLICQVYYQYYFFEMELDDFVQEADWLLFYVLHQLDSQRLHSFIAYYKTSLHHLAIQFIRKQYRKKVIPKNCIYQMEYLTESLRIPEGRESVQIVELKEKLGAYLCQLSPYEKSVFLEILQGKSVEEIAFSTHKTRASVTRAYYRCRQKYKHQS